MKIKTQIPLTSRAGCDVVYFVLDCRHDIAIPTINTVTASDQPPSDGELSMTFSQDILQDLVLSLLGVTKLRPGDVVL